MVTEASHMIRKSGPKTTESVISAHSASVIVDRIAGFFLKAKVDVDRDATLHEALSIHVIKACD